MSVFGSIQNSRRATAKKIRLLLRENKQLAKTCTTLLDLIPLSGAVRPVEDPAVFAMHHYTLCAKWFELDFAEYSESVCYDEHNVCGDVNVYVLAKRFGRLLRTLHCKIVQTDKRRQRANNHVLGYNLKSALAPGEITRAKSLLQARVENRNKTRFAGTLAAIKDTALENERVQHENAAFGAMSAATPPKSAMLNAKHGGNHVEQHARKPGAQEGARLLDFAEGESLQEHSTDSERLKVERLQTQTFHGQHLHRAERLRKRLHNAAALRCTKQCQPKALHSPVKQRRNSLSQRRLFL